MQKIVELINNEEREYLPLRISKFFTSKYHFNSASPDMDLLEWLLTREVSGFTDLLAIKDPRRVQAFLILRTLVSMAAYSHWYPESEFSDLFEFGLSGVTTGERVQDLATEVCNDLELLKTKIPSEHLNGLVAQMREISESLPVARESEESTPFFEFEKDPFWQFEKTWEERARKNPDPRKEVVEDPFASLIEREEPVDVIEEMVEAITVEAPVEPPPVVVAPLVSSMNPVPPRRPNRIQPRVFSRTQFKEEQGKDFMRNLMEEVKRESTGNFEGGI